MKYADSPFNDALKESLKAQHPDLTPDQIDAVLKSIEATAASERKKREGSLLAVFAEIEKKYSKREIQRAIKWVEKAFEKHIRRESGMATHIVTSRYIVTNTEIEAGLTTLPVGFKLTKSYPVRSIALIYADIILDDDIQHKLTAIIESPEAAKYGHASMFARHPNWNVQSEEVMAEKLEKLGFAPTKALPIPVRRKTPN